EVRRDRTDLFLYLSEESFLRSLLGSCVAADEIPHVRIDLLHQRSSPEEESVITYEQRARAAPQGANPPPNSITGRSGRAPSRPRRTPSRARSFLHRTRERP